MHRHQHRDQQDPAAAQRTSAHRQHPIAALQQTHGNTAVSRLVLQRAGGNQGTVPPAAELRAYVDDWLTKTDVSFQRRSAELRAIDKAITTWLTGGNRTPGDLDVNETQLVAIRTAVRAWRDSKTGQSSRGTFIDDLATRVDAAVGEIAQRRATRAGQQAELDKYRKIDPDMAGFAARTRRTDALDPGNKLHEALSADRDTRGGLTGRSMDMLDEIARGQLGDHLAIIGGVTPNGVTPAQVQQIMANNVNQVTGRTIYPELASYLDTAGNQPALPTEQSSMATGATEQVTRAVGTTRLTVHWDRTDSQRDRRLASLVRAVELVQQNKFDVPPLTVYLPRYGRNLVLSPDQVRETGTKVNRAEYIPPDALVASPELLDNPLAVKYGADYQHLSTQLDPSGVGTMVHELGHFLHYHQNRSMFHDLTATSFASGAKASAADTVSGYAGQKPREFVAEVFLGLVYGRTFSPDVMEMYQGLGGPKPSQRP